MTLVNQNNVGIFLLNHTPDKVRALTYNELCILAIAIDVQVESKDSKAEVLEKILNIMYSTNSPNFEGFGLAASTNTAGSTENISRPITPRSHGMNESMILTSPNTVAMNDHTRLELARIKLETEKLKIQAQCEIEREKLQLQRELENERIQLERERIQIERIRSPNNENTRRENVRMPVFDVTKHVRMVPTFTEDDPTGYFLSFERVANNLDWPEDKLTLLLHSALKGRALEVFTALTDEESNDYEVVKESILRAYELVPEAYRVKFRNYTKVANVTFSQHLHGMRKALDRWLHSRDISEDYEKLYDVILFENFCNTLPKEIKTHLADNNIQDPVNAATAADKYSLSHRLSVATPNNKFKKGENHVKQDRNNNNHTQSQGRTFNPPNPPNTVDDSADAKRPYSGKRNLNNEGQRNEPRSQVKCHYCGKLGHIAKNCYLRKREMGASKESYLRDFKAIALVNEKSLSMPDDDPYKAHRFTGTMKFGKHEVPVNIVRDTGASRTLVSRSMIEGDFNADQYTILCGIGGTVSAPLIDIELKCTGYQGTPKVAVVDTLPIPKADILLGNDLIRGHKCINPLISTVPQIQEATEKLVHENPDLFPVCAVTRAMARETQKGENTAHDNNDVLGTKVNEVPTEKAQGVNKIPNVTHNVANDSVVIRNSSKNEPLYQGQRTPYANPPVFRDSSLRLCQREDPGLQTLWKEAEDDPDSVFHTEAGLLMRQFTPQDCEAEDEKWRSSRQIVVPTPYRQELLKMAHDHKLAAHIGCKKTLDSITRYFWWPGIRKDVSTHCQNCDICQRAGKPNQVIKQAPLIPIPRFDEPFDRVLIDIVGPLPKTRSGNEYMLTIMDMATRFPEAIPLRKVSTESIAKELIKFFSLFGLPKEIQSDQGSCFTSHLMKQLCNELGVELIHSSAYHPQSQGALERFHQTLKSMLRKFSEEHSSDWDLGLPLVMFAAREVPNESLGFSPFELLFTHEVKGPMKLISDTWRGCRDDSNLIKSMSVLRGQLREAWRLAGETLKRTQTNMKTWYDKNTRNRTFQPGEEILLFSPIPGQPLSCKFQGPYTICKKLSDVNYVVSTPDRRKKERVCHINLIKRYHRDSQDTKLEQAATVTEHNPSHHSTVVKLDNLDTMWDDEDTLQNMLPQKLEHLQPEQRADMEKLVWKYKDVFRGSPGRTTVVHHDVDVMDAAPVKQRAYRVNPKKASLIKKELEYLLAHQMIVPGESQWSSPVTLVDKPGGSVRFCVDYRQLNKVSKTDSYPLPRVDECIDTVEKAMFITKLDLLKGFWQIPLTKRAQEVSCFATLGGSYMFNVMPFGMKNSSATFQRMINKIIKNIEGCVAYIDDIIIYSDTWVDHLTRLEKLLKALQNANLVVKLSKCTFVHAQVEYLGYVVGQGTIAPPHAKVKAICDLKPPNNRKEVRRILGMAGYYRMFLINFADLVAPLTDLLKKERKFVWTKECEEAFQLLKLTLSSSPILLAPDFNKPFKLAIDASNIGAGAVLLQDDKDGVERPVSYYSKKFNQAQCNYSVIEKELLALIFALQFYNAYVSPSDNNIVVYTDHHPLKYLNKFHNKNQRLTRWSLLLQEYNLDVIHIRGRDNVLPDLLSRCAM